MHDSHDNLVMDFFMSLENNRLRFNGLLIDSMLNKLKKTNINIHIKITAPRAIKRHKKSKLTMLPMNQIIQLLCCFPI